jgi:hypothetical protein
MVIGGAQQQSAGIGSGGLPMWRWDLGNHPSDGLSLDEVADRHN